MRKTFLLLAGVLLSATLASAQETMPTSFPRKHIIEHFTGAACPNCPAGIYFMNEWRAEHPNSIVISNHAGYKADQYTIAASNTLVRSLGISGAPEISLNRTQVMYMENNTPQLKLTFHPGYLTELIRQPSDEAVAEVLIETTYNAATRSLSARIHGRVASTTLDTLALIAAVKESGLFGSQQDNYSVAPFTSFCHNNAVREYLTPAYEGIEVPVVNQAFDTTLTTTINTAWVAENCMFVAYVLNPSSKDIINAEEEPVVAGTDGGSHFRVEDSTPGEGPQQYLMNETFTRLYTDAVENFGCQLTLTNTTATRRVSSYTCYPYMELYLATPQVGVLADGTYPLRDEESLTINSAVAGMFDFESWGAGGSLLYLVTAMNGSLYPMTGWYLASGTIEVSNNGKTIVIDAQTLNGYTFHGEYGTSTDLEETITGNQPVKVMENGRLHISKDGYIYDVLGTKLK